MRKSENRSILLFLTFWTVLIVTLILHASGRVDVPLLHFPQATGSIVLIEADYKHYNILGLKEELFAIPQPVPFIHPRRKRKLREVGIFVSHSLQEAKRMVDAGTEDIEPRLILKKTFHGFNLYSLGNRIYSVPMAEGKAYSEQYVGASLEEAEQLIQSRKPRDN